MIVATPALRPDGALVIAGMDGAPVRALSVDGLPLFHYERARVSARRCRRRPPEHHVSSVTRWADFT